VVHRASKIVKFRKSYSNAHLPYFCSFYYVACEYAWAVRLRRKNSANVHNMPLLKLGNIRVTLPTFHDPACCKKIFEQ